MSTDNAHTHEEVEQTLGVDSFNNFGYVDSKFAEALDGEIRKAAKSLNYDLDERSYSVPCVSG